MVLICFYEDYFFNPMQYIFFMTLYTMTQKIFSTTAHLSHFMTIFSNNLDIGLGGYNEINYKLSKFLRLEPTINKSRDF